MRTKTGVLPLLLAGAALAACNGAGNQAMDPDTGAALSRQSPEPPDEATPPEPPAQRSSPPIMPDVRPPDVGPPDTRPDPLPPGQEPPEGAPPGSPPPPTSGW